MRIALHLGLGDLIVCAPIIARLANDNPFNAIEVPCWKDNLISVKDIFSEIPNVVVFPVDIDSDFDTYEYKLGFYNNELPPYEGEDFITWFMRQAEMTEAERWYWCPVQNRKNFNIIKSIFNPVFIHDKETNKIEKDGFRPTENGSILNYIHHLTSAQEIHCIDSSFLHLVEAIPTTGKLFFHKYARDGGPMSNFKLRKEWTVYESN